MTAERILAWTPDAVVFDCDGTLMDTERHWIKAREVVLRDYGAVADPEFAELAKGRHYTECGALMAEALNRPDLTAELTGRLLDSFRELVADDPVPMPGAVELVHRAARFAPLAVASNCPRDVVEACLDGVGLLECFRHIVVPAAGVRPKPYPDVYATAARKCGAEPVDCLAVEDSACGVQAAVAAGLRVLGVSGLPPADGAGADWWVATLAEPELTAWAESRLPDRVAAVAP
jgi:HAD superfamily hydrolase (TIGR01509 family)